jgi:multidrug efflux pump
MSQKLTQIVGIIKQDPAIENVVAFTGGGGTNGGFLFISLVPYKLRPNSTAIIGRLRNKLNSIAGAQVFLAPVQDIRAGGRPSPALYQYTLQSGDLNELRAWGPRVVEAFNHIQGLTDVNTDQQSKGLQIELVIDRDAAAKYGVSINTIDQTLNDAFGQRLISTIYAPLNQYRVVLEADWPYQQSPEMLNNIYLMAANGKRVPLSVLSHFKQNNTPLAVNHHGLFAASTISFNLDKTVSLGQAQQLIAVAMARIGLPGIIQGGFQGTAKLFQDTVNNQPLFIITAILVIYIVLGVLYESTVHPLTILSTLPSAGIGAVLALMLFKTDFSIIALIGVFLLIGIVKKNAILMVDFALQLEKEKGMSPHESIHTACLMRLRPILMTTLAALFTALPLAMITGNGAELRAPLGISIAGGLIVSQLLTLYTTPVIYLELEKLRLWVKRRWGSRNSYAATKEPG